MKRAAPLGILFALGGCVQPCPTDMLSPAELIAGYNRNADAAPRLWARARIAVTLVDAKGRQFTWGSVSPLAEASGLLLLAKSPAEPSRPDFVLIGRQTGTELFRLGHSAAQGVYYFWYSFGDRAGAWFGLDKFAGAPGVESLPIDPMQLLSLLCIVPLPSDPTELPAAVVTMRDCPGDCAYVVTYVARQAVSNRILFRREAYFRWSSGQPPRPYRVDILDAAGRRVLTGELSDWRPVDVSTLDEPPAVPPIMPTRIDVAARPAAEGQPAVRRICLVLSEMTAADKWRRTACRFQPPAGVVPVQVDAHLAAPASRPAGEPAR